MPNDEQIAPRQYHGVMISSTFNDLKKHRAALISAINREDLHEVAMENSCAKAIDVIASSLQMVQDGSAYIGVISHKYGKIPQCQERNPNQLSITELEFNEAQRLNRPILLFIMGDNHYLLPVDFENDFAKREKLNAFRERAKQMQPDSLVHRVYCTFNSLEEFSTSAAHSIAELRRNLIAKSAPTSLPQIPVPTPPEAKADPIPTPPDFYAEPSYIGSHKFVGRQAQLDTLSDWATPADSHPVLLFEAIGGTGKSILTWEWTTTYSSNARPDWAGRFWYSFYERGATMTDFCRRALAYMTRQSRTRFREKNTAELTKSLIHHLQAKPWLLILDGLERILVSYHRSDAAQVRDEGVGNLDKIAHRDPCAAINPEDDDLLRALAGASPSKLLLTTRLMPRVLINKSNQPIPGVLRELLPGLRPADAEALIRSCGITGTSLSIQSYLKSHCDCHPLVIGVLAGLINDYLPDRGNFDSWADDPIGGGQLNLENLDLIQKRNHILSVALIALSDASRQLLSTLALLSESVDYPMLCALNPYLPPIPEEVPFPRKFKRSGKLHAKDDFNDATHRREEYEQALVRRAEEVQSSAPALSATVKDLERRGLLQYDAGAKRYDLHPVVRGIVSGGLKLEEKNRFGQRVVDHFSLQAQNPYDQANTLEEFDNPRHIVKVLFQMGKLDEARSFVLRNSFIHMLNHRFEAHNEILTILHPFFSAGWNEVSDSLRHKGGVALARIAAIALRRIGALQDAFDISEATLRFILKQNLKNSNYSLCSQLLNIASTVGEQNHLAQEDRLLCMARDAASTNDLPAFWLARFRQLSRLARWPDALTAWNHLSASELPTKTSAINAHHYAVYLYQHGTLTEEELAKAERSSSSEKSALGRRNLCALRGFWQLEKNNFEHAKQSLQEAVALAHKVGKIDRRSEICLAIAKYNLNELYEPNQVAEKFLYDLKEPCYLALAELWFAIGDHEQAKKHAFTAYKWAWADGEPYVRRYELNKSRDLLKKLGAEIPALSPYDPTKDEKLSWEDEVAIAIAIANDRRVKTDLI